MPTIEMPRPDVSLASRQKKPVVVVEAMVQTHEGTSRWIAQGLAATDAFISLGGIDLDGQVSQSVPTTQVMPELTKWTKGYQRYYSALAGAEALDQLSPQKAAELEYLHTQRRNLLNPLTTEEMIWAYRQRKVTEKLLDALSEYVDFSPPSK